jgi:2Fe-2S ferredoxin
MPTVKFVEANGEDYIVEVESGTTAMRAAVDNGVRGIDGDCGGNAACATCHVFVDPDWIGKTGPAAEGPELEMLSLTEGFQENSRLGCQIILTDALDGLVLRLPVSQF